MTFEPKRILTLRGVSGDARRVPFPIAIPVAVPLCVTRNLIGVRCAIDSASVRQEDGGVQARVSVGRAMCDEA